MEGRTYYMVAHRGIANTKFTEPALWQLTACAYDTAYNGCLISQMHCLYCIPFFVFFIVLCYPLLSLYFQLLYYIFLEIYTFFKRMWAYTVSPAVWFRPSV